MCVWGGGGGSLRLKSRTSLECFNTLRKNTSWGIRSSQTLFLVFFGFHCHVSHDEAP